MFKNNATLKILFIGFLTIVLMVPLVMVQDLIYEREDRYREAVQEVSSKWSMEQVLMGPILTVPYEREVTENGKTFSSKEKAYFLPDVLKVNGSIVPEVRSRGIFDVVLYKSDLQIEATFPSLSSTEIQIPREKLLWSEAKLLMGIPDLRGIQEGVELSWDGKSLPLKPGVDAGGIMNSGVTASLLGLSPNRKEPYQLSFRLSLQGSSSIQFAPLGKQTSISLQSSWPTPSFDGGFLPSEREVSDDGFTSSWEISYFGRSYPQQFTATELVNLASEIERSTFGVSLLQSVDYYQQNTRSVKYGILFILLTFAAFFLFEVLSQLKVHPLQYLLVGFAMCVFYLLLLSLSEQIGFGLAYLVSAVATVLMIGSYSSSILKKRSGGLVMGALITGVYTFLYVVLQLEDYALLIGSIAVFMALALMMYLTRNIDWYSLKMESPRQDT